ncbi:MAG TPA: response regulator [Candidatus Limnocylindrales bacterium]|nr:response regulator [Candidatus Limnocylindrales bacterium]
MNHEPAGPMLGKILVIDDNPIIQRAVYFQFRDQGYQVLMAGEITKSLTIVRTEKPDVILLDINFPAEFSVGGETRDGFWAINWLQKMEEARGIPVIIISSESPAESEPRALAAGAVAFFPKPLDKDKLLATVQKLMAAKKPAPPSIPGLKMAS